MRNRWLDIAVGLFIIAGLLGLLVLAFKVSGLTQINDGNYYILHADFDNIGDLKARAPVTISGVKVGRISGIQLNPNTFRAAVTMQIDKKYNDIPIDTSASILTQGLLGSNYISLSPGFEQSVLRQNGKIETTHSALILENLVGQLMFNLTNDKDKDKNKDKNKKQKI